MMRKSPLKRKTPMKRTRIRQKPVTTRTPKLGDDPDRLTWMRKLPCCACNASPPSHAHHSTGAGMALKAQDSLAMPLCHVCHRALHDHTGMFRTMNRPVFKSWQAAQCSRYQTLYGRFLAQKLVHALSAGKHTTLTVEAFDSDEG